MANNPPQLANFIRSNGTMLAQYQITEDMIKDLVTNGGGFSPQNQDNNSYSEEQVRISFDC